MTLILTEQEKEAILDALSRLTTKKSTQLLTLLKDNPDCTVWVIITKEEREKWGKKNET